MTFSVRTLLLLAILFLSIYHTMKNRKDKFHRIKSCKNGHGLKKGIVEEEGYECNLCGNPIGESESIYSCDRCEYDVCYNCRRKKQRLNTKTTKEVYLGMTGKLEYRGSCLKFQVIEIDPTKHFMHKVTYPNECFRNEWLLIDLTSEKKYHANRTQNSHNLYHISNDPDNVFKTLCEAGMDWFLDLDQCDKEKAVQLFSKLIQHYNGCFNQDVLTDMEEKLGILPEQIQQFYEFLFSKKNTQPKNDCNILNAESNAKKDIKRKRTKTHDKHHADEEARMDWFDGLDQRDKDNATQLLSQGIQHYNGLHQDLLMDMKTKFGIIPAQTQQLYDFLYSTKNNDCDNFKDKKIAEKVVKSNDIDKDDIGKDDIEIVSADVSNNLLNVPRDVEAKMTGTLMYKGKEVDFEVRSIGKPKENEKQKHFIFYLHKDAKQQADWVHLDLKKSAYTSYGKNGQEVSVDKILSVKFLDGSEFNSCPKVADKNEAEKLSNVNLKMGADCVPCVEANALDPFLKN